MNFTEARATAHLLRALAGDHPPDKWSLAAMLATLSCSAGAALQTGPVLSDTDSATVCAAISGRGHPSADDAESIHTWFGLSYSSYLVLPRVLMQNMPLDWQHRFTAQLHELQDSFSHVEQPDDYQVLTGSWVPVEELTDTERRALNLTSTADGVTDDVGPAATAKEADAASRAYDRALDTQIYYDAHGKELHPGSSVFIPGRDPLPGYRHAAPISPLPGYRHAAPISPLTARANPAARANGTRP